MHKQPRYLAMVQAIVAVSILFTAVSAAQAPRAAQPAAASNAPQMSEKDVAALQDQLLQLLRAHEIGITLTEEDQLDPEQSTSAIVVHHPQAKYFSV